VWLLLAATAIGVGILVGILEVANRTEPVTESRGKQPSESHAQPAMNWAVGTAM
jgi:hypothetical protein